MKNKIKITTTIVSALIIGLITMSPMTIIQNVNAQTAPFVVPPSPTAVGCYHYATATGWQTTQCLSEAELKEVQRFHPAEGGSSGVKGEHASSTQSLGETDVTFSTYSGESDSGTSTSNTWSIQTNTNQWK